MKVVLSQEDGTLFLASISEIFRSEVNRVKASGSYSDWTTFCNDVEAIGKTYRRHGFGFVTFDVRPSRLYDIKKALIASGCINSTRKRSMIMRVDESLSLFYRMNPSDQT